MKNTIKYLLFFSVALSISGCENHINKYKVNVDSLQTLPAGFYAYRRGCVYVEDGKNKRYRIWYNLTNAGAIQDIVRVNDFRNFTDKNYNQAAVINKYAIDTIKSKVIAQKFIDLSRKFKFGLISIDKKNEIFFSYKDGLSDQYVMPLNDSVKNVYDHNTEFTLLKNGWFKNTER